MKNGSGALEAVIDSATTRVGSVRLADIQYVRFPKISSGAFTRFASAPTSDFIEGFSATKKAPPFQGALSKLDVLI